MISYSLVSASSMNAVDAATALGRHYANEVCLLVSLPLLLPVLLQERDDHLRQRRAEVTAHAVAEPQGPGECARVVVVMMIGVRFLRFSSQDGCWYRLHAHRRVHAYF